MYRRAVLAAAAVAALVLVGQAAALQPDQQGAAPHRQLQALGWGHYLSSCLNTLVSAYTKSAIEGKGAAVQRLLAQQRVQGSQGAADASGGGADRGGSGKAERPGVNLVQLPSGPPSSGINVRTRTPVSVDSPVRVRTPKTYLNAAAGGD